MRVEDVEIHAGAVDFPFQPIRRLEAKCEAPTNFSKAPTMADVNLKLRELALQIGANAIVEVTYQSGPTLTSWRSIRGYGIAVKKESDERQCPVCAETVKRAAKKCRFCRADLPELPMAPATSPAVAHSPVDAQPPLRAMDNSMLWLIAVGGLLLLFWFLGAIAS